MSDWVLLTSVIVGVVAFMGGVACLLWPGPIPGRFFRLGVALIPLWLLRRELETIDSVAVYRNIPFFYLWLWVLCWILLSAMMMVACLSATVRARLVNVIGTWGGFGGLWRIWGPYNVPFWSWLVVAVISTLMFCAQGISDHDVPFLGTLTAVFGTIMEGLRSLWGESATTATSNSAVSVPQLPLYPVTWWWAWLAVIAWGVTPISGVLVYRDEVVDYLRKIAEKLRLRRAEAGAGTGVSVGERDARPAGVVAPIGPVTEQTSLVYWIKHLLWNLVSEWTYRRLPGGNKEK